MRWNHPDTVADPDEIASDTFIKALEKQKEIQAPEKLLEWLLKVAENLMIDAIRRSRQTRRLAATVLDGPSVSEGTMLAETDAEYTEANRELLARLLRLLQDQDHCMIHAKNTIKTHRHHVLDRSRLALEALVWQVKLTALIRRET